MGRTASKIQMATQKQKEGEKEEEASILSQGERAGAMPCGCPSLTQKAWCGQRMGTKLLNPSNHITTVLR